MSKFIILSLLSLSCLSLQSNAVNIENNDDNGYTVKTHASGLTGETSVSAHSASRNISSSDSCTVEVVGVGSIDASGNQTVVIQNGSLSVKD